VLGVAAVLGAILLAGCSFGSGFEALDRSDSEKRTAHSLVEESELLARMSLQGKVTPNYRRAQALYLEEAVGKSLHKWGRLSGGDWKGPAEAYRAGLFQLFRALQILHDAPDSSADLAKAHQEISQAAHLLRPPAPHP